MLIFTIAFVQAQDSVDCPERISDFTSEQSKLSDLADELYVRVQLQTKITKKHRCDLSRINDVEEYVVAHDGASAYAPAVFHLDKANSIKQVHASSRKLENISIKQGNKKAYSPLRNILLKFSDHSKRDILYFSQTHAKESLACIKKMKKLKPDIKIKLIGYSWGGNAVQKVVNELEREDIKVSTVFTIDPVRKGTLALGAIKNLSGKKDSKYFKKNKNVKTHFNVFQKTDDGSLGPIKIHGNSISDADINLNLSKECSGIQVGSDYFEMKNPVNHMFLDFCNELHKLYQKFLNQD